MRPNPAPVPGLPPADAIAFFRAKGFKVSFDYRDTWKQEHAIAFTVAKATSLDVLGDIRTAVDAALAQGQTFEQFRKQLTPILQQKGWWGRKEMLDPKTGQTVEAQLGSPRRLRTIYQANIRSAMAAGQWERAQRTKRLRPYFLYQLGPSIDHREEHVALEGLMLPVDDPFWNTHFPPNGWGCKCWVRQIGQSEYDSYKQGGVPSQGAPIIEKGLPTGRRQPSRVAPILKAPPVQMVDWLNKRTGQVEKVPDGIDPGWDVNPGRDRQARANQQLQQKQAVITPILQSPPTPPLQPQGTPVSAAAQIKSPELEDVAAFLRTLDVINKVHGDGALQPTIFDNSPKSGSHGTYFPQAQRLAVLSRLPDYEFCCAHEIGHWLDHQGLPGPGLSSASHPDLAPLMKAIRASASCKAIRINPTLTPKYRKYMLEPWELFARAYAQFIAEMSRDPSMLASLNQVRQGLRTEYPVESQWSEQDFAPIKAAMIDLFRQNGWIK